MNVPPPPHGRPMPICRTDCSSSSARPTEGLRIAEAIAESLSSDVNVVRWSTAVKTGETIIEGLDRISREIDFAVFVHLMCRSLALRARATGRPAYRWLTRQARRPSVTINIAPITMIDEPSRRRRMLRSAK